MVVEVEVEVEGKGVRGGEEGTDIRDNRRCDGKED